MASTRHINTKIWIDDYVHLLPITDKLVFVYLLTNGHTSLAGIYELPLHVGASELGIAQEVFMHALMRLNEKVRYINGWVVLKNFVRHQAWRNEKVLIGVRRILADVPPEVIAGALKDNFYWLPAGFGESYPQDINKIRNTYPIDSTSDRVSKRGLKHKPIPYDRTPFTIDYKLYTQERDAEKPENCPQGFPQHPKNEEVGSDERAVKNANTSHSRKSLWTKLTTL